jgi:mRNA interferase MazF
MGVVEKYKRFEVYLVDLDPTIGSEIQKIRPCVIISPDEMNKYLKTVIVAPMTTKGINLPSRVNVNFNGKDGQVVLDQVRSIDKQRLVKSLGKLPNNYCNDTLNILSKIFSM